jgi:hypothetical protein
MVNPENNGALGDTVTRPAFGYFLIFPLFMFNCILIMNMATYRRPSSSPIAHSQSDTLVQEISPFSFSGIGGRKVFGERLTRLLAPCTKVVRDLHCDHLPIFLHRICTTTPTVSQMVNPENNGASGDAVTRPAFGYFLIFPLFMFNRILIMNMFMFNL